MHKETLILKNLLDYFPQRVSYTDSPLNINFSPTVEKMKTISTKFRLWQLQFYPLFRKSL